MYSKKYIVEKIEEFNWHNYIYDDMEGSTCYLAYFNVGERGWFLYEVEGYFGFPSAHRIHTSIVKNVEYSEDYVVIETENTKLTFRLDKSKNTRLRGDIYGRKHDNQNSAENN